VIAGFQSGHIGLFVRTNNQIHQVQLFLGHEHSVSSLHFYNGLLVSGGWDGKAIVWRLREGNFERLSVLGGHENVVCCTILDESTLVTGSSGISHENRVINSTLRLWKSFEEQGSNNLNFKCIREDRSHLGSIRCLKIIQGLNSISFVSGSNDATVRVWDRELNCLKVLTNPHETSFIFSISQLLNSLPSCIIVSHDSGKVDIFNLETNDLLQTFKKTSCVWDTTELLNGDIVTACSDKKLRFWSTKQPSLNNDDLDDEKCDQKMDYKRLESLIRPISDLTVVSGAKNNQLCLFYEPSESNIFVYSWNSGTQKWKPVGRAEEPLYGRYQLNGKFYDMVVPVEIDSASKGFLSLMLGFNQTDDPLEVAEAFCKEHDLLDEYIPQIAFFVSSHKDS